MTEYLIWHFDTTPVKVNGLFSSLRICIASLCVYWIIQLLYGHNSFWL